MATPPMIGAEGAQIFYSGSGTVLDDHRQLLDAWAQSSFEGDDAGLASLLDLAMLAGMYSMFAGFLQGAAGVQSAGFRVAEFAERPSPFLSAMAGFLGAISEVVDSRDFASPEQSLNWTITALETISRASREHGVDPSATDMVAALVQRQIDAGHGTDDFS